MKIQPKHVGMLASIVVSEVIRLKARKKIAKMITG